MEDWSNWLYNKFGLPPEIQYNLMVSFLGIAVLWLIRTWLVRLIIHKKIDPKTSYTWQRVITSIFYLLGIFLLADLWLRDISNLATYLGLLSAGLAIALRDPLANAFGWLFILWRRPFVVGDRVQIGETKGDVVDLRIFQFSILEIGNWVHADQSTGRIINIPNSDVFTKHLANYTRGFEFLWNELEVTITFESDWEKAKTILEGIIDKHASLWSDAAQLGFKQAARQYLIYSPTVTPIVYTSVEAFGVKLTLRYLCPVRQRRDSSQTLWEEILRNFSQEQNIDLAYPTTRFYDARTEGKGATGTVSQDKT